MIVFIHHSVNHYRVAFFNKLAQSGVKFKVYFLSKPAKNRRWKVADFKMDFNYEFLDGWKLYVPGNDHSYFQLNRKVWSKLQKDNPTLIISIGWNYLATFTAFLNAKAKGRKFALWSESTVNEKSVQRTLTLPIIKLMLRNSDFLIAAGTNAKEYLLSLGANPKKILVAYYTIDTDQLINKINKESDKSFIHRKFDLKKGVKTILFVGQLIKRKGVVQILNLAKKFKENTGIVFILVGYGPMEEDISNFIRANKLNNLRLAGFVPNDEVYKYYMSCDIFLLPSLEETWGLVVNEAMCAGKPVLVSKFAGSSADLVENGINGFIVNPYKEVTLVAKIKTLVEDNDLRKKMGNESLRKIRSINLTQNVNVIKELALSEHN